MATAPDAQGVPRLDENDRGADGTFSGLLNLAIGWLSTALSGVRGTVQLTAGTSAINVSCTRLGKTVRLTFSVSRAADMPGSLHAATLPVGFRPTTELSCGAASATAGFANYANAAFVGADGRIFVNLATLNQQRSTSFTCTFEVP